MSKPTVEQLKALIGNRDVYAVQNEDGDWFPVRSRLTPGILRQHLAEQKTVGTYIVRPPDQARTLVFDIDAKSMEEQDAMVNALGKILSSLGLDYALEDSGNKGYHYWIVAEDFMDAATLYRLGRGIREEAGLPKLEVFPKQTEVRDLGNLVKLPGGIHRVTGRRNDFVGPAPGTNPVARLEELAAKYPEVRISRREPGEVAGVEFPCVAAIQEGVQEGGRNIQLFHLAVMLRKFSLSDENVEAILRATNEKSDPPLDEDEFAKLIENSRFSGPVCSQLDEDTHCGEQCILAKHSGLYTRAGALKWAGDGENVVVTVLERGDDGHIVELSHPDIGQARAALLEDKPKRKTKGE